MPRAFACLTAVLVIAGVMSGCGEDETKANNAYVAAVNVAQDRFQRTEQRLQEGISTTSTTPTQDRRTLDSMASATDDAIAALRAVEVPKAVAPLHRRLISAVASYRPVIRARRKVIGSDDPRELINERDRFDAGARQVQTRVAAAIRSINAKLRG